MKRSKKLVREERAKFAGFVTYEATLAAARTALDAAQRRWSERHARGKGGQAISEEDAERHAAHAIACLRWFIDEAPAGLEDT